MVENLQSLLSAERQKEFAAHVSGQEKETEIQHLRQQLTRLEADRLALNEQLRTLRSEVRLKGEEIQRLQSELADERFQGEHTKQQLISQQAHFISTARLPTSTQLSDLTTPPGPAPPRERETATPTGSASRAVTTSPSGEDKEDKTGDIFSQERDSIANDSARESMIVPLPYMLV